VKDFVNFGVARIKHSIWSNFITTVWMSCCLLRFMLFVHIYLFT